MFQVNQDITNRNCKAITVGTTVSPMDADTRKPLTPEQLQDAARLKALFEKHAPAGGQLNFGLTYGVGSQAAVSHYLNGIRPLNLKVAVKFAKGLGVAVHDFSPTLAAELPPAVDSASDSLSQIVQSLPESSGQQVLDFIRWQFERDDSLVAKEKLASYMSMIDGIVKDMEKRKHGRDSGS